MATKAVTLKNSNDDTVYPVTDVSLVNGGIFADTIAPVEAGEQITTNMIADGAVTVEKLAPGIVTLTRTVLFSNSSGTAANITVSQALNNFDQVEFYYKDNNSAPNQAIRAIPGDAEAVALEVLHPGGSGYLYINAARWTWTAGATTLTYSSNHFQKEFGLSSFTTSTSSNIMITKIVGVKFVSN